MNPAILNILLMTLSVIAPVLTTVITGMLGQLWVRCRLQSAAVDKDNMERELHAALSVAITKVIPQIAREGWASPGVRSTILAEAADYFQRRFPDRTKQITVAAGGPVYADPASAVAETLKGRLSEAIAIAAASPGTPPAALEGAKA